MNEAELNERIINLGKKLFAAIRDEKPSLFNTANMLGKVMEWAMRDEKFKLQLLRFVDVFPILKGGDQLTRHIREYFGTGENLPPILSAGVKSAGLLGSFGGSMLSVAINANIHEMARQFIIGENIDEAMKNCARLRREGFALAMDLLGEATLSHEETRKYRDGYLELVAALATASGEWSPFVGEGGREDMDWGDSPLINIAVKPSALFCLADPRNFQGSVDAILNGVAPIAEAVISHNGLLCLDMESTRLKDITLEVYRRLKLLHPDYPWLGIAMQAYLRDTDRDLAELLSWAGQQNLRIAIRLVKGAYWDYEMIRARQSGWQPPVWTAKAESDAAFERQAGLILEHHAICHLSCATHNIRSIAAVLEKAKELDVPRSRYEFQVLYGMAEPVRRVLLQETGRIRLYAPYGAMIPGMGYLVRRLLENTANDSFLRRTFVEEVESESLLKDPAIPPKEQKGKVVSLRAGEGGFSNEPGADFTIPALRRSFVEHLEAARSEMGGEIPLFLNGIDQMSTEHIDSINPAEPAEIVGQVSIASEDDVTAAITAARKAFLLWRDFNPGRRVEILRRAAAIMRERLVELSAWQVLEIGKQWDQAYADVTEAIDFLEYYGKEMLRLAEPVKLGNLPGEINRSFYEPCGVATVISPWNFPLAISCGMSAAALVTGNCVLFKPSSLTPVIGRKLADIFRDAGMPPGVFNYLPGKGETVGKLLVESPEIDLIAFTGSSETGLEIMEKAGRHLKGQRSVKRVICEMGGKNAIIIDDDADLDEAIPHILQSAFGFQGQKCSACSRVIVLDGIYQQFLGRFIPAVASLQAGPAEDPANFLGPVADQQQRDKILKYIEIGKREGKLLFLSETPEMPGYYVPIAVFGEIRPFHRLAREEIFGPVLAVMRAEDFTEALHIANDTPQALTGSVFSRSPANLERAGEEFKVGNLYLNRGCTGAMVMRQPFGGFRLSGGGTKAGGSDYLLHFLNQRVVTENTMRRGFAPTGAD